MNWHAGRILFALARHFDWQRNYLMPEYEIGGRADLVVITPAGYVTEVEIKVSLADWKADTKKRKWATGPREVDHEYERQWAERDFENLQKRRAHVARFFYAIPETLADKIPDDLPDGVGILVVHYSEKYGTYGVKTLREAVRRKSTKLSKSEFQNILRTCYFRYWNAQFDIQRMIRDREQAHR